MNKKHGTHGHDLALTIVIDGESAEDLLAVGVDDLIDLLHKKLYVKKKDIVKMFFKEIYKENGHYVWVTYDDYKRVKK